MKKTLSLALSLIMILATFTALPFTALADETGTDGVVTWTYTEADKTLTITGKGELSLTGSSYSSTIRSNTEIVKVAEGITSICESAFSNFGSLKKVNIPASVTKIGEYAFDYTYALEEFVVAKNSLSFVAVNGVLFNYGKGILVKYPSGKKQTEYTVPSTVISIYPASFDNADNLVTVKFAEGCKSMGEYAFYECDKLQKVVLPNSLKSIPYEAFYDCSELKSVNIPNGIVNGSVIGEYAFSGVSGDMVITASCDSVAAAYIYGYYGFEWEKTHKFNAGTVIKAATLTSTGSKVCNCENCGESKIVDLPKLKKNTLSAKGKTVKLKYSAKAQSVKAKKAVTVKKAQGAVSYKIAKKNKNFKVAKNGKITVKKGLKAGTYKVKIKVTAAGNESYAKATKTVTVKIVIK